MENPLALLKSAATEENDSENFKKILKACKLISESLPFDEIAYGIFNKNKELVKYLFLSAFVSPTSIEMIIASLLEKFQGNESFMKYFWEALHFCSRLQEHNAPPSDSNRRLDTEEDEFLTEETHFQDDEFIESAIPTKQLFNSQIQQNVLGIKLFSLRFVFDTFTIAASEHPTLQLDEHMRLFFLYLHHSSSEKLILQTVSLIENIKNTFLYYFTNITKLDSLIQSVFMRKSRAILSNRFMAEETQGLEDSVSYESMSPLTKRRDGVNPVDVLKINILQIVPSTPKNGEQQMSKDPESEASSVSDFENTNTPNEVEKWMSQKDMDSSYQSQLIIGKSEYMMNLFRQEINVRLFLSFIFFPEANPVTNIWQIQFPQVIISQNGAIPREESFYKTNNSFEKAMKTPEQIFRAQTLRSFKAMQVLCVKQNLQCIINSFPSFFQITFESFQDFLSETEHSSTANINHIAKIIETLILFDQDSAIFHIFSSNLLFSLLDVSFNNQIYELLEGIVDLSANRYGFTKENLLNIAEYINKSSWFSELCAMILSKDQSASYKKDKSYQNKKTADLQRKLLVKITEKEKRRLLQLRRATKMFRTLKTDENLMSASSRGELQNSKISLESLASNRNKQEKEDKIMEYVFPHEIDGSLQNIDNLNIQLIQEKMQKKKEKMEKIKYSNRQNQQSKYQKNVLPKQTLSDQVLVQSNKAHVSSTDLANKPGQKLIKNAFYSSKLLQTYPDNQDKTKITVLEEMSKSSSFSQNKILSLEKYSYPCSMLCMNIIRNMFQIVQNHEKINYFRGNISKGTGQSEITQIAENLLEMFLDENSTNFQKLLNNYLIKMIILTKHQDIENSACISGKIVNFVLENLSVDDDKYDAACQSIISVCSNSFDFACKTIFSLNAFKIQPTKIQGITINNPIGTTKTLLVSTLGLIARVVQQESLYDSLRNSIWHTILLWLFNSPTSSSYGLMVVDLLQSCFNLASEKHIIGILFKLSTVSCLHNAFEVLTYIGVPLTGYHADTFIMIIRRIVVSLHQIITDRKFNTLQINLSTLSSWRELLQAIPQSLAKSIELKEKVRLNKQNTLRSRRQINTQLSSESSNDAGNINGSQRFVKLCSFSTNTNIKSMKTIGAVSPNTASPGIYVYPSSSKTNIQEQQQQIPTSIPPNVKSKHLPTNMLHKMSSFKVHYTSSGQPESPSKMIPK